MEFEIGSLVVRVSNGDVGYLTALKDDLATVRFKDGKKKLSVDDLRIADGDPDEQLADGLLHDSEAFRLRLMALYLSYAFRYDPVAGLTNARIEPKPHQISVAHRVMTKFRPRMILADEVGLGKTIEAGLVIKESLARGSARRILVVCPASLQRQWEFELRTKFNEKFEILDSTALKFYSRDGGNPWERVDKVIASLHLARRMERAEEIIQAEWDLVIFDEAHRVRRKRDGGGRVIVTKAYELADELKEHTDGVLLLTATPMQLDAYEFYSLIELVEPGLFRGFEDYDRQRRDMPQLNKIAKGVLEWPGMSDVKRQSLVDSFPVTFRQLGVNLSNPSEQLGSREGRDAVMDALVVNHPLTSVMVRNRKSVLGINAQRSPHRIPVQLSDEERKLRRRMIEYVEEIHDRAVENKKRATGFVLVTYRKMLASSSFALVSSLRGRLARLEEMRDKGVKASDVFDVVELRDEIADGDYVALETAGIDPAMLDWEIARLSELIEDADGVRDSKLETLAEKIVQKHLGPEPDEKILIFTGFRQTQSMIVDKLRSMGFRVAQFNGSMNLDQKEAAVADFRDRAQVLVSTEAGGEGRNFQFAHIMVNYDLPWNPMVVEQRIGRLDRIGQDRPVQVYNLFLEDSIEEQVLDVLDKRIGLFTESVGSLDPILGEVEQHIERLVLENRLAAKEKIAKFGDDLEAMVRQARLAEEQLSDFVMDASSLRQTEANELLDRGERMAGWEDLRAFVDLALRQLGGSLSRHDKGGDVVDLSVELQRTLSLDERHYRGSFDPDTALAMEEIDFFAFGHELVDSLTARASETTAVSGAYVDPESRPGEWIELIYNIEWDGARPGGRLVRHRVDRNLEIDEIELKKPSSIVARRGVRRPLWTESAIDNSLNAIEAARSAAQVEATTENEKAKKQLAEHRRRRFGYEGARLEQKIAQHRERIANAEESDSEGMKKVLPAWRGRLNADLQRLSDLEDEFEHDLKEIRDKAVSATASVISAAVVIGE